MKIPPRDSADAHATGDTVADNSADTDPGISGEEMLRRRVKAELRKRMRGLRKTMPLAACDARSARIVEHLLAHEAFAGVESVALFWPIEERHEVDLRALDGTLRERGVRVGYPTIDAESGEMLFREVTDLAALEERGYGFREPPGSAPRMREPSVIVVPALAVAPSGHRLGYGRGYYDRALAAISVPVTTLAVAYDFQLLVEVPATSSDVAVQWIVTDARVLKAQ